MKNAIIVVMFMFYSSVVIADCTYEGAEYPEGSTIGPYVCSGGKWVSK